MFLEAFEKCVAECRGIIEKHSITQIKTVTCEPLLCMKNIMYIVYHKVALQI